jgi:hypothetical protein
MLEHERMCDPGEVALPGIIVDDPPSPLAMTPAELEEVEAWWRGATEQHKQRLAMSTPGEYDAGPSDSFIEQERLKAIHDEQLRVLKTMQEKYPLKAIAMFPVLSEDVRQWPEFIAFADRLGISIGMQTTALDIKIGDAGELVQIVHKYLGIDTRPNVKVTVTSRPLVETTDIYNKQFRTFAHRHSPDCGTKYRGCAPDCPKDQQEKQEAADGPHFIR